MAQGQKKRRHSNTRDVNNQVNDLLRQAIRARAAATRIAAQAQRAQSATNRASNNDTIPQSLPYDSEDSEDDVPQRQRSTNRSSNTNNNATTSTNAPSSNVSTMSTPEPMITMVTECLATMKSVLNLTDRCVTDLVMFNIQELMQQREDLQKHGEWSVKEMRRQAGRCMEVEIIGWGESGFESR